MRLDLFVKLEYQSTTYPLVLNIIIIVYYATQVAHSYIHKT